MSKSLSGTIFFEFDAEPWGGPPGGSAAKISDRGTFGYWGGDRAALEIKNIYIDWAVPVIPVPVSMRIGLQNIAIRPNLMLVTDGMGISTSVNLDPVMLQLIYAKAAENNYWAADDVDIYGLHARAKVATFTIGGYGLYYNMNSFPLWNPAPTAGTQRSDMWWFGIYADGKAGPVDINFDFILDTGNVKRPGFPLATHPKVKYNGWETRLKVDFPWEQFNFGFVGMYASGADRYKTSSTGLAGTVNDLGTPSTKVGSFVVPPGSEASGNFGEGIVVYGSWINRNNTGYGSNTNYNAMTRGPAGGTWFAKLYAGLKPVPWYKATFQVFYVADTTKHGNTFGNAYKYPGTALTNRRDDKEIGWEFDLINEIQIYKNLKYSVGLGYLFAGNGLDWGYRSGGISYNSSPKNPWNVLTNLTYSF
jgi:hypothetical protein